MGEGTLANVPSRLYRFLDQTKSDSRSDATTFGKGDNVAYSLHLKGELKAMEYDEEKGEVSTPCFCLRDFPSLYSFGFNAIFVC